MATAKKSRKSKTTITEYIQSFPSAKAADIAKHLGVSVASVYIARSKLKKLNTTSAKAEGVNIDKVHKPKKVFHEDVTVLAHDPKEDIKVFSVDMVNQPPHYKVGGVETIDFIEAKGLGYNLGNVVKYVTRADHKGSRKENLEKARWYLERELSRCA
jgi:hypothetical protein